MAERPGRAARLREPHWQLQWQCCHQYRGARQSAGGNIPRPGVPRSACPGINHRDPLASPPLNVTALTWPWRYGYKFTTIDLETSGGVAGPNHATGFSIHLGSTDCGEGKPTTPPSTPCGNSNRPTYRLEVFDPKSSKVVLDLGALLAETDITVNALKTASGCMSGPGDADCTAIMN
ncbi:MAG: metallo-mystery pair system four-Cys motif protein, partial [Proteobacteria bacterium]|nr:metallo-mystery pair system four-Cys motif protein [Pseudomonadota bacterium]